MERLSAADLDRALRFVGEIEAIEAPSHFPTRMLSALKQLIPCDMAGYNEVDRSQQRVVMVLDPDVPEKETFARVARQHPVLQYHARSANGRALKISDFLTRRQYHGLELYQDAFRLINAEDQMSIALPAQPSILLGIALNRDRPNFSERDRRLLDLVRPHLTRSRGCSPNILPPRSLWEAGCQWPSMLGSNSVERRAGWKPHFRPKSP